MTSSKVDKDRKPYRIAFTIRGLPKMSNQLLRGHWRVKHDHAKNWKKAVANALEIFDKPPQPLNRAILTITRHSSRRPDYDGLVSAGKPLIDALVEQGVLVDDNLDVIGVPSYLWEKASMRDGRVTIVVEEACPAS